MDINFGWKFAVITGGTCLGVCLILAALGYFWKNKRKQSNESMYGSQNDTKCPCGNENIIDMQCVACEQPAKGCSECFQRLSKCACDEGQSGQFSRGQSVERSRNSTETQILEQNLHEEAFSTRACEACQQPRATCKCVQDDVNTPCAGCSEPLSSCGCAQEQVAVPCARCNQPQASCGCAQNQADSLCTTCEQPPSDCGCTSAPVAPAAPPNKYAFQVAFPNAYVESLNKEFASMLHANKSSATNQPNPYPKECTISSPLKFPPKRPSMGTMGYLVQSLENELASVKKQNADLATALYECAAKRREMKEELCSGDDTDALPISIKEIISPVFQSTNQNAEPEGQEVINMQFQEMLCQKRENSENQCNKCVPAAERHQQICGQLKLLKKRNVCSSQNTCEIERVKQIGEQSACPALQQVSCSDVAQYCAKSMC